MLQYDDHKINMKTKVRFHVAYLSKNSNKKDIRFKELLSHYARLQPWIPFYKATVDRNGDPLDAYYRKVTDAPFSTKIADTIF